MKTFVNMPEIISITETIERARLALCHWETSWGDQMRFVKKRGNRRKRLLGVSSNKKKGKKR